METEKLETGRLETGQLEYVRLCEADEISQGEARRFVVGSHEIAVARAGDETFAIGDVCSHGHFLLSEGEVDEDECTLECPKHGSCFNLRTGEPETLPATVPVAVYPLKTEGGSLLVGVPSEASQGGASQGEAANGGEQS